jgi:transcriptional regulator with PAS, ATPase and Fis domain
MNLSNIYKYKTHLKVVIAITAISLVYIFGNTFNKINADTEQLFRGAAGGLKPDTSIIILHITKNDFEKLGSYPLKRSYYALLINQLTALNVKAIGLDIFLSERLSSQSVYNSLLDDEIKKSGKVVLASLLQGLGDEKADISLLMPEPKKEIKDVVTGHSNYLDKDGIIIPLKFKADMYEEKAFALSLLEKSGRRTGIPNTFRLNIISSWKRFQNYSLLEFFGLMENGDIKLKGFKDKIVIIGISDPEISGVVETAFDDELPGVALQAFAVDNLLNNRYLKKDYMNLSTALLILLLLPVFGKSSVKKSLLYIVTFALFILSSFILLIVFNIQVQYSVFFIPFLFLTAFETGLFIYEKRRYLKDVIDQTAVMKSALEEKETELIKLQKEYEAAGENTSRKLIGQINELKEDIRKLKLKQTEDAETDTAETDEKVKNFCGLVYKSRIMASVTGILKKTAPGDATILITGESGTGKELAAKAFHILNEKRKDKNFVAVNCAALTDTLLESELFGHVKGAFTGAVSDKIGRFEAADKGTIFLDEIGETSENFQTKLLRVLQTGEFEKVGSSKTIKTDVRIIAATNKNLEQLVKEKKFREDLYYRLNVIKIEMPSLRDRKEDIEALAFYFASREKVQLSKAVLEQLNSYKWKGNVRELESVMKRAAIFAKADNRNIIKLADLPDEVISKNKMDLETLILESLREKKFSHSSINETAKEIGDLSRTIVSENFRGIVLRNFYESGFDKKKTIINVAGSDDLQVTEKVKAKIDTFLNNIEDGVFPLKELSFEEIKTKLNSKYKNLPQKYHSFLDEIIKYFQKMENIED